MDKNQILEKVGWRIKSRTIFTIWNITTWNNIKYDR